MIIRKGNINTNYLACFTEYFRGNEESAMACAYEIGRNANTLGIGILELLTTYHHALNVMLHKAKTKKDILRTTNVAQQLFSESLASYEMTNRGFHENLEKLLLSNKELEKEIAERKKSEDSLQESERKYRDLFNNMAEEVHFWKLERDLEGRIKTWRLVDVNPPALKTWGRQTVDELRGKTTDEIFGPGSTEHYMPVVQKIMTEGIPCSYEDYFPNLNKYFQFTSVPMGDYFITTGADITKVKQNETSLARYAGELAFSNKELEAFSYSVSHDLRAPLRSLDGFSSILLEDYSDKLDAQGKKYLNHIKSSAELMSRLIDDMLRLSRIGRAEMRFEKVNLSEMVRSIAEELRHTQPERNAEFVVQPDITAEGDKSLLKIMLYNLLENAWKYTAKVENSKIEFSANKLNGRVVYSIRDNGAGFDMTYADKLFKPFQRLHPNTDYQGTGIGLAIVQRIVNRHGGKAWAEGKVWAGATFYFTLT
jgi:PAS domain-containing protein